MTRPAIAKKTIESRRANRPFSPRRAVAFHPVAAELASVCGVAPWGVLGSELGGADEGGCISGGGVDGHREELCHVAPALNEFLIVLTPVQSEKHTGRDP